MPGTLTALLFSPAVVLVLALASQSLSVIFELIPYVRETFRRHLSQKQAVMLVEFDKLKRVRLLACYCWRLASWFAHSHAI